MKTEFQQIFGTAEPAALGPQTRPSRKSMAELEEAFSELDASESAQALLLLWHDYLDEAHDLAQKDGSADGSFIHAIMHRREPDFGNSKYWFHRAGAHPAFPEIARRAGELKVASREKELLSKIAPGGKWGPFAFVDAVQRAGSSAAETAPFLREVQEVEFAVLLEHLTGG